MIGPFHEFSQLRPWIDGKDQYAAPFHEFSQLRPWIDGKDQYTVSGEALADLPSQEHLDERAAYWWPDKGLEIVGECWGHHLVLPVHHARETCPKGGDHDGFCETKHIEVQSYYVLVPLEEVDGAVQTISCCIHDDFGNGRVWTLSHPVHFVQDDGMACAVNIGGARHYLMRSWVFHENGKQA